MQIVLRIVLVLAALAMMAFGAMDFLMGFDLLGKGFGARVSGGLAVATGIAALVLLLAATPQRSWSVVILASLLVMLRLGRFPGSGYERWETSGWGIFGIMIVPPLVAGLIALTWTRSRSAP